MRGKRQNAITVVALLLAGLTAIVFVLLLQTGFFAAGSACLLCVWLDIPPWVRTAIAVVTSMDAIGGAIGATIGEQIGGPFGRGFGRKLGENVGSGDIIGLATGGTGVITGAQSLGEWAQDQAMDKIQGDLQDKGLDFLLGDDAASREQEALDWFQDQF